MKMIYGVDLPKQLVRFLNAGYDAVKNVCPDSRVITHLASVCDDTLCRPFLVNFFAENGKTDILSQKLKEYSKTYHKPVMIVETGGLDYDDEGSYKIVTDCINAMKDQQGQDEMGVFYWEPEATAEILPDKYPLCAGKFDGTQNPVGAEFVFFLCGDRPCSASTSSI